MEIEKTNLRRVPTTFNVRTDLLDLLEQKVPSGLRSRWLEGILIKELLGEDAEMGSSLWVTESNGKGENER